MSTKNLIIKTSLMIFILIFLIVTTYYVKQTSHKIALFAVGCLAIFVIIHRLQTSSEIFLPTSLECPIDKISCGKKCISVSEMCDVVNNSCSYNRYDNSRMLCCETYETFDPTRSLGYSKPEQKKFYTFAEDSNLNNSNSKLLSVTCFNIDHKNVKHTTLKNIPIWKLIEFLFYFESDSIQKNGNLFDIYNLLSQYNPELKSLTNKTPGSNEIKLLNPKIFKAVQNAENYEIYNQIIPDQIKAFKLRTYNGTYDPDIPNGKEPKFYQSLYDFIILNQSKKFPFKTKIFNTVVSGDSGLIDEIDDGLRDFIIHQCFRGFCVGCDNDGQTTCGDTCCKTTEECQTAINGIKGCCTSDKKLTNQGICCDPSKITKSGVCCDGDNQQIENGECKIKCGEKICKSDQYCNVTNKQKECLPVDKTCAVGFINPNVYKGKPLCVKSNQKSNDPLFSCAPKNIQTYYQTKIKINSSCSEEYKKKIEENFNCKVQDNECVIEIPCEEVLDQCSTENPICPSFDSGCCNDGSGRFCTSGNCEKQENGFYACVSPTFQPDANKTQTTCVNIKPNSTIQHDQAFTSKQDCVRSTCIQNKDCCAQGFEEENINGEFACVQKLPFISIHNRDYFSKINKDADECHRVNSTFNQNWDQISVASQIKRDSFRKSVITKVLNTKLRAKRELEILESHCYPVFATTGGKESYQNNYFDAYKNKIDYNFNSKYKNDKFPICFMSNTFNKMMNGKKDKDKKNWLEKNPVSVCLPRDIDTNKGAGEWKYDEMRKTEYGNNFDEKQNYIFQQVQKLLGNNKRKQYENLCNSEPKPSCSLSRRETLNMGLSDRHSNTYENYYGFYDIEEMKSGSQKFDMETAKQSSIPHCVVDSFDDDQVKFKRAGEHTNQFFKLKDIVNTKTPNYDDCLQSYASK